MSLVTISSIAAFDGAQTRILRLEFCNTWLSMDMMPLMVWVFPVPAICKRLDKNIILTWSLNKQKVNWLHLCNINKGLKLTFIEFGSMFIYEGLHLANLAIIR